MFRKITFFLIILAFLGCYSLRSQTVLKVETFDGQEFSSELTRESCMSFASDSITIHWDYFSNRIYYLKDVHKLVFSEIIATGVRKKTSIIIYPNPVNKSFIMEGVGGDREMFIYSMNGIEVLHSYYHRGKRVDVRSLKPGNYIVRIGDRAAKFIKK